MAETKLTDPAREIADICKRLDHDSGVLGAQFLADCFNVTANNRDFNRLVFCIWDKIDSFERIVNATIDEDDIIESVVTHISSIRMAFEINALSRPWRDAGKRYVGVPNVTPIRMLSPHLRTKISYAVLSEEEVQELTIEVQSLIDWLKLHELEEQDFYRQATLEGLDAFSFRLKHINWLGWGYTYQSLKGVIAPNLILAESNKSEPKTTVTAILEKVESFVLRAYTMTKTAKDVYATGEFMLKAYGTTVALTKVTEAAVKLIAHLPSS